MTENIFGWWCRRFPIIKDLRTHLTQSQKTIVATAILQNITVAWQEPEVDGEDENDDDDDGADDDINYGSLFQ